MKIGIPRGLLYYKYSSFVQRFLYELDVEVITSPMTNKKILDEGVKYCVDEACLPIKVFHGHVASIKDRCDMVIVPRIMQLKEREYICPKFCGLPEMVKNSIPDMPQITETPIYAYNTEILYKSIKNIAYKITKDNYKIKKAFNWALFEQGKIKLGLNDKGYKLKVALAGHPYNIYDEFVNMNLVKKLNELGIGVITEEIIDEKFINIETGKLFKRPFWTFARKLYGSTAYLVDNNAVDGIIYISSFACGIDSVVTELIKERIGDVPMLVLKIDEHTGEAGLDTRIEAFSDMLKRRCKDENYFSAYK